MKCNRYSDVSSSGKMFISSLVQIGKVVQKFKEGGTQHGDLMSLLSFLKKEKR
jgi:hypothetical protein